MTKRTLYLILALAPAIFILIPSVLGYYLYSPINNGFIQVGWFAFFVWMWTGEIEKGEEKKSWKRHKIGLALVGIWLVFGYMSASFGSGMKKNIYNTECGEIVYYSAKSIEGGPLNMFGYGGGAYKEIQMPFFVKKLTLEEENTVVKCLNL